MARAARLTSVQVLGRYTAGTADMLGDDDHVGLGATASLKKLFPGCDVKLSNLHLICNNIIVFKRTNL